MSAENKDAEVEERPVAEEASEADASLDPDDPAAAERRPRRKRGTLRVPSDNVPRPQGAVVSGTVTVSPIPAPSAETGSDAAMSAISSERDADIEVEIEVSDDEAPAAAGTGPVEISGPAAVPVAPRQAAASAPPLTQAAGGAVMPASVASEPTAEALAQSDAGAEQTLPTAMAIEPSSGEPGPARATAPAEAADSDAVDITIEGEPDPGSDVGSAAATQPQVDQETSPTPDGGGEAPRVAAVSEEPEELADEDVIEDSGESGGDQASPAAAQPAAEGGPSGVEARPPSPPPEAMSLPVGGSDASPSPVPAEGVAREAVPEGAREGTEEGEAASSTSDAVDRQPEPHAEGAHADAAPASPAGEPKVEVASEASTADAGPDAATSGPHGEAAEVPADPDAAARVEAEASEAAPAVTGAALASAPPAETAEAPPATATAEAGAEPEELSPSEIEEVDSGPHQVPPEAVAARPAAQSSPPPVAPPEAGARPAAHSGPPPVPPGQPASPRSAGTSPTVPRSPAPPAGSPASATPTTPPAATPATSASTPPAPPPAAATTRKAPPAPPPRAAAQAAAAAAAAAAEPKPRKRKGKVWFEDIFDEDYLRTLPYMTPQATQRESSFIVDGLAVKPGAHLLDIGCGYGRHAMELAARGYHVVGLDLSLPLLIRGADEAQRRGLTINFVHADMRELTFDAQFDGAYCVFSTFGYFDDETNRRVASNLARALKPGARLLLDVLNRDYVVADLPARIWWEGDGCVVLEEVNFNYFNSRVVSNRSVVFEDGRQLEQEISIRLYSLHELGKLLHGAGFRVLEVSGSPATRGRFFGSESRQMLIIAERRPPDEAGDTGTRPGLPPSTIV